MSKSQAVARHRSGIPLYTRSRSFDSFDARTRQVWMLPPESRDAGSNIRVHLAIREVSLRGWREEGNDLREIALAGTDGGPAETGVCLSRSLTRRLQHAYCLQSWLPRASGSYICARKNHGTNDARRVPSIQETYDLNNVLCNQVVHHTIRELGTISDSTPVMGRVYFRRLRFIRSCCGGDCMGLPRYVSSPINRHLDVNVLCRSHHIIIGKFWNCSLAAFIVFCTRERRLILDMDIQDARKQKVEE